MNRHPRTRRLGTGAAVLTAALGGPALGQPQVLFPAGGTMPAAPVELYYGTRSIAPGGADEVSRTQPVEVQVPAVVPAIAHYTPEVSPITPPVAAVKNPLEATNQTTRENASAVLNAATNLLGGLATRLSSTNENKPAPAAEPLPVSTHSTFPATLPRFTESIPLPPTDPRPAGEAVPTITLSMDRLVLFAVAVGIALGMGLIALVRQIMRQWAGLFVRKVEYFPPPPALTPIVISEKGMPQLPTSDKAERFDASTITEPQPGESDDALSQFILSQNQAVLSAMHPMRSAGERMAKDVAAPVRIG